MPSPSRKLPPIPVPNHSVQEQQRAPYFEALQHYVDSQVLTFHVPGHQQGMGAPAEFGAFLSKHGWPADITQVLGMDDIHRLESVCQEAQELAAQAYEADKSYFLINGSSCGNHAMLMATLRPGDKVLMARNSHRSAMGGLMLSGAQAAYFETPYDPEMRVFQAPTVESVREALDRVGEVKALFFTSPTYYGAAADTKALVELARSRGVLVLVDEAWGAHLAFHPELPQSAVAAGADLVVQSTHKMVSGLTQTAMLHLNGASVDRSRLESVLRLLQSTSPSCLLVASMDATRRQMALHGRQLLEDVLRLAHQTRERIQALEGISCFGKPDSVDQFDPTRLTICASERGYNGYELELFLREEHNIQVELSDLFNVIALFTLGHKKSHADRLLEALEALPMGPPANLPQAKPSLALPQAPLTLQQAFQSEHESVALESAVGRISAEMLTTYPPGIPVICPGELFRRDLLDYIRLEYEAGSRIEGAFDPTLRTVRVIRENNEFINR